MRRLLSAVCALLLAAPAAAHASEIAAPMDLPRGGASAAGAGDWLIGVRHGTPTPAGATQLRPGTLVVPRVRAREVAADLRRAGALLYAEPDRRIHRASVSDSDLNGWARGAVVDPALPWPVAGSPIGVIDDFVDPLTPDLNEQVTYLNATTSSVVEGPHGTEVASAAAAANQGAGITGVLPGARIASYGVPTETTCADVVNGIDVARAAGIKVVNISLGSAGVCYTEYLATQKAYGAGMLIVASAGNDYEEGNPVIYPAAFPHVMSVAAIGQDKRSAAFSSANAAVDVSAPGVGIPLAIPPNFDVEDGQNDGYTLADGTSFSSPMVAGAAEWVRTMRPDLTVGQLADALRFSAEDLAQQGYDDDTGWGLINVGRALQYPTPANDPLEPNDGIAFVDGRVFSGADRPVWNGRGSSSLSASADQWEDPLDVYRVTLRPRSRVRISLRARFGDSDLQVYDKGSKAVGRRRGRICTSAKGLKQTDRCTIVWRGGGARTIYVAVNVATSDEGIASGYTLRFSRL